MATDIDISLRRLCTQLNGKGCANYVANIQLYRCPSVTGRNLADTVSAALGQSAVIQSSTSADRSKVLESLKAGMEYEGDDGAHPNRAYLACDQFRRDEEEVLRYFGGFLEDAIQTISFRLREGHPFYPVFWDFAFLIEKRSESFVLIGSSSD